MTGHGGTALTGGANNGTGRGGRLGQAEIVCDCGRRFTATRTLVGIEPDHYESPEWEAHVRATRTITADSRVMVTRDDTPQEYVR